MTADRYGLLVVDMQNGFCHPDGSFPRIGRGLRSAFMRDFPVTLLADCCAAKTRRLHDLSIEVLSSYELAEIATVTGGFDAGRPDGTRGRLPSPVLAPA